MLGFGFTMLQAILSNLILLVVTKYIQNTSQKGATLPSKMLPPPNIAQATRLIRLEEARATKVLLDTELTARLP